MPETFSRKRDDRSASFKNSDSRKICVSGSDAGEGAGATKGEGPLWSRRPRRPDGAEEWQTAVSGFRILQEAEIKEGMFTMGDKGGKKDKDKSKKQKKSKQDQMAKKKLNKQPKNTP